ncbi:MAG: hypothetical protein NTW32_19830 [Chloroflexi bacterium]|nr:hypothetical protein [Chloroflexota bacterium]
MNFNDVEGLFDKALQIVPMKGYYGVHERYIEGENGFHWAKTKDEFYQLLRLYVYLCWGDDNPAAEAERSLNTLVDELAAGKIDSKEFSKRFNDDLDMCSEWSILWCGLFDDLLTSQEDDPCWVRSEFFEENDNNVTDDFVPAVPDDRIDEFAEYLANWA